MKSLVDLCALTVAMPRESEVQAARLVAPAPTKSDEKCNREIMTRVLNAFSSAYW